MKKNEFLNKAVAVTLVFAVLLGSAALMKAIGPSADASEFSPVVNEILGDTANAATTTTTTANVVKRIVIATMPTETKFHIGDTLDTSGMTLTVIYTDKTTATIEAGYTVSPSVLTTVGSQEITISYGGQITTYTIVVLNHIEIVNGNSTATIDYGDTLRLTAQTDKVPANTSVKWSYEGTGVEFSPVENSNKCDIKATGSGSIVVTATAVDELGDPIYDASGRIISDSQEIKIDAGLWQKIVSFFKDLFNKNRLSNQ